MHVYHVTRHEGYELSGDLGLFADLGGALVKVHEAMNACGAFTRGVEVIEDENGLVTYTCGLLGIGWTIERRPVR